MITLSGRMLRLSKPVDIRSRGSLISKLPNVWLEGPSWLTNITEWSNHPVIRISLEFQKEAKLEKQIVVNTVEIANAFDKLLEKHELQKALRLSACIKRFIKNFHHSKQSCPLTASEIGKQKILKSEKKKLESSEKLNLIVGV